MKRRSLRRDAVGGKLRGCLRCSAASASLTWANSPAVAEVSTVRTERVYS